MLPSKFFDPPSSSGAAGGPSRGLAPPPLGMTGVMCKIGTLDIKGRGTIHYRIFRPRQLQQKSPLILVHGGPLIPSNYLLPLAYVVVDRSIVVYDQLGCGQSAATVNTSVLTQKDDPKQLNVQGMVEDLDQLIEHWNFPDFHLLGHSFGGILIFEYLKYCQEHDKASDKCRTVILASAPTSTKLVEDEVQRLCEELGSNGEDDDDDDEAGVTTLPKNVPKEFRSRHECRLVPTPFPLVDSYRSAGPPRLRGLQSIGNYEATLTEGDGSSIRKLPQPTMILRGQHDFVSEGCVQGWDDLLEQTQHMTLAGCSHYGMLENEIMYGSVISSFLSDCDR